MNQYTVCHNCGQEGHFARQCTEPAQPQAARALQGTLAQFCPVCGSQPGHTCRDLVTGEQMYGGDGVPVTHPARSEHVWQDPVLLKRRQELREQNPRLYPADNRPLPPFTASYGPIPLDNPPGAR